MKRQATDWEKIFANHTLNKGLIVRIHKEFLKVNYKKTNSPILKMGKRFEQYFIKEDI